MSGRPRPAFWDRRTARDDTSARHSSNKADEHRLVLLQGDRRHAGDPSDGVVAPRQIAEVLVSTPQRVRFRADPLSQSTRGQATMGALRLTRIEGGKAEH
jgi:hypothetical protein